MPWSGTDKTNILKFLGYPPNQNSLNLINEAMVRAEALDVNFVAISQDYLTQLLAIETSIKNATSNLTAGVTVAFNADDNPVEYRTGEPLVTLRSEGTRYTYLLAELLGLIVYRNWFGEAVKHISIMRS